MSALVVTCFNGAALFQVRKAQYIRTPRAREAALQWGRTLSSAESFGAALCFPLNALASMGPHSFKCGKRRLRRQRAGILLRASMGPHSFKCGKLVGAPQRRRGALLQWGRTLSSAERLKRRGEEPELSAASMGPHSFKCGKQKWNESRHIYVQTLQWGRTLSSAESWRDANRPDSILRLLQWGRTLSSAERVRYQPHFGTAEQASMGPHSFKCGKRGTLKSARPFWSGFNGAALFQVRKGWRWAYEGGGDESFNGAALFQVRKV